MKIVVAVALLSSLASIGFFLHDVSATEIKNCEGNADCTVAELDEYCRTAYGDNDIGYQRCLSQTPTPNTGP